MQAELVGEIFPNVRALRGMAVTLQDTAGFAYDYQLMLHRAGMTQVAMEKQLGILGFAIERLKQGLAAFARMLGDLMIPQLTEWADKLTAIEIAITRSSDVTKEFLAKLI